MDPLTFFTNPTHPQHRQYEALRSFYVEGKTAEQTAQLFDYTVSTVYAMARDFKKQLVEQNNVAEQFFVVNKSGRKPIPQSSDIETFIVALRKQYLSVPDIKSILDTLDNTVSEKTIHNTLKKEGFARLPRRDKTAKEETLNNVQLAAPKSLLLTDKPENFSVSDNIGILCLTPYFQTYGIDQLIGQSLYPETKTIPKLNAILSFVALKLVNIRRYSADDRWCMNRGMGLFAGLNVLPKAAWFTSYSHRVTRKANLAFLKAMNTLWQTHGRLGDTANLDFTSLPYWGNDNHLENNWSGSRHRALSSLLTVLAQDPDTGIITYGDTNIRHRNKDKVVLEFLDFYHQSGAQPLKYLVFDSKFTTYENLAKLDAQKEHPVKFITIRRRGKNIMQALDELDSAQWRKVRVPTGDGKTRELVAVDQTVYLKEYGKEIRQMAIKGHGKIKPALIITNDFDIKLEAVLRKYARRWLVEKEIAEQIYFFHLNQVSSSMVIKVDFDLTMSILAHNLYRVLATDLPGYSHNDACALYEKFLYNAGEIKIGQNEIEVLMKKKRNLPALLTAMDAIGSTSIGWLGNKQLIFRGASST